MTEDTKKIQRRPSRSYPLGHAVDVYATAPINTVSIANEKGVVIALA